MSNLPLVSIIIVNFNGKTHLEKCLNSLKKVNYSNFETILVDNNSTDGSVEFVTKNYSDVIIIKLNQNKGYAEPNNIGARLAKGDYLLFLNNDTVVTPNFLSALVHVAINDPKIAICQSLLLRPNGEVDSSGDFIDKLGVAYNSITHPNSPREISSARGASMLIKRDFFNILGGFDDVFFASFEDVDLGWRSWIAGYKVILVPSSIVYHFGGQTIKKIKDEIAFHGFKNQLTMKITNFEGPLVIKNLTLFFIIYGIRELRILLDYKLKGYTQMSTTNYETNIALKPSFKIIFKSIGWIICHQKYLCKKHKQVNSLRVNSTKNLQKMNILSNITK